jgi:hypothetical protein
MRHLRFCMAYIIKMHYCSTNIQLKLTNTG